MGRRQHRHEVGWWPSELHRVRLLHAAAWKLWPGIRWTWRTRPVAAEHVCFSTHSRPLLAPSPHSSSEQTLTSGTRTRYSPAPPVLCRRSTCSNPAGASCLARHAHLVGRLVSSSVHHRRRSEPQRRDLMHACSTRARLAPAVVRSRTSSRARATTLLPKRGLRDCATERVNDWDAVGGEAAVPAASEENEPSADRDLRFHSEHDRLVREGPASRRNA